MRFVTIPDSVIDSHINAIYKTKKKRAILHDRVVEGMTYRQIARKHYQYALIDDNTLKAIERKIRVMEQRLYKRIHSEQ